MRCTIVVLCAVSAATLSAQKATTGWKEYLGGADSSHYSPLKQIDRKTVGKLEVAWSYSTGAPVMGTSDFQSVLLMAAGIVSTTPLLLFTAAARRLQYSTLGMLQFIAPTLQFLIAVLYGEPLRMAHFIAFPAIWLALGLYVTALLRAPRLPQPPE